MGVGRYKMDPRERLGWESLRLLLQAARFNSRGHKTLPLDLLERETRIGELLAEDDRAEQ